MNDQDSNTDSFPENTSASPEYVEAVLEELQNPIYQNMDIRTATYLANQKVIEAHKTQTEDKPSPLNPGNPVDSLIIALANLED